MRVTSGIASGIEKAAIFVAALAVNLGLYLLVPYIQILILKNAGGPPKSARQVVTEIALVPPSAEKLVKREIKEIKTQNFAPPQAQPARPSTPGGGLKIDLSPAGGEGLALVSGGDRTGAIGSGSGGGQGSGIAAMTYEPGQTDTDARIIGEDPKPDFPNRANREGVAGVVTLAFVINESGFIEQISVIKEEPVGYGFAAEAIKTAKKLHFKPATLQKMSVRQTAKKTYHFDQ